MTPADIETLHALREAIVAAENSGDLSFFAAHFDDDAVVMPPDAPVREGKTACLAFVRDVLQAMLAQFDRDLVCQSAEIVVNGGFAFDRGSFFQTLREKDSGLVVRERGHYLWLYVRRSDGWKLSRAIWNGGEEVQDLSFDLESAEEGRIQ